MSFFSKAQIAIQPLDRLGAQFMVILW